MRKILFTILAAMTAMTAFTSCEKEEQTAFDLSGNWETTDALFERQYQGRTIRPVKTVFSFDIDKKGSTVGEGVAVEYFDIPELAMLYHHIKWDTWSRKDGSVGFEVLLKETRDKFSTTEFSNDAEHFSGKCYLNDLEDCPFSFKRTTAPDVSKARFWGYNELMPTWYPSTYKGVLDIRRQHGGVTYKPTSVTITFDVDPVYNDSHLGYDKAYVMETYDSAPWGGFLADSIRHWSIRDGNLTIYLAGSDDTTGDYYLSNVKATPDSLVGDYFVETNVFTHFNLKRTTNPDWSTIKQWGILNRIR